MHNICGDDDDHLAQLELKNQRLPMPFRPPEFYAHYSSQISLAIRRRVTSVSKIALVPNQTNTAIIEEFRAYVKARSSSEQHQNNNLKVSVCTYVCIK